MLNVRHYFNFEIHMYNDSFLIGKEKANKRKTPVGTIRAVYKESPRSDYDICEGQI